MFGYNRIKIMGEDIGIMSRTYQNADIVYAG
jgi:hypothetical protein